MESQPQNAEFWNNPENFHPCYLSEYLKIHMVNYCSSYSRCKGAQCKLSFLYYLTK